MPKPSFRLKRAVGITLKPSFRLKQAIGITLKPSFGLKRVVGITLKPSFRLKRSFGMLYPFCCCKKLFLLVDIGQEISQYPNQRQERHYFINLFYTGDVCNIPQNCRCNTAHTKGKPKKQTRNHAYFSW
jgi:hypothetical protein